MPRMRWESAWALAWGPRLRSARRGGEGCRSSRPTPAASSPPGPKRNERQSEHGPPVLSNGPALIDGHGRLRQEDIPVDGAVSDVESVEPVRPTSDSQSAGEPVVQLPADPPSGKQSNCRRPARPGRQPVERFHTSEHSEPIAFVPQADTDLAKVFSTRTRLEAITLGHLDEVGRPRGKLRQREADRCRVPASGGLSAPRLLRPGCLDPLHRDVHRTCPSPRAYGRHSFAVTWVPAQLPAAGSQQHSTGAGAQTALRNRLQALAGLTCAATCGFRGGGHVTE